MLGRSSTLIKLHRLHRFLLLQLPGQHHLFQDRDEELESVPGPATPELFCTPALGDCDNSAAARKVVHDTAQQWCHPLRLLSLGHPQQRPPAQLLEPWRGR